MKSQTILSGLEPIPNSKVVGYAESNSISYILPRPVDELCSCLWRESRARPQLLPTAGDGLLDDFVSFSKTVDIPNYRELDEEDRTVTVRSLLHGIARIESDGGRIQVCHKETVKLFCPYGAEPTGVLAYPPQMVGLQRRRFTICIRESMFGYKKMARMNLQSFRKDILGCLWGLIFWKTVLQLLHMAELM
jgi:hypothetical protein